MSNSANRILLANYLLGQQSATALGKNYVLNQSAFQNTANVTASGAGTSVARNTSSPLTAISDFSLTLADDAVSYIEWALGTLDNSMNGQNCELRLDYTAASVGSNVLAQIYQNSVLVAQSDALAASSTPITISVNVPCGDLSGATTVRIANGIGNSGAGALKVANVTYGKATNLGNISTTSAWIPYTPAFTQLGTVTNVAVFYQLNGNTLTVKGSAQSGSNGASAMTIPLPTGFEIDYRYHATTATVQDGFMGRLNSTNQFPSTNYGPWALFADGSDTTNMYLGTRANGSGAFNKDVGQTLSSNDPFFFEFSVPVLGGSSEDVYRAELLAQSWSGYHNTDATWSVTNTAYTDLTNSGTPAIVEATNTNFGTVATAGSNLPGITFTPKKIGKLWVCALVQSYSGGQEGGLRLWDGTTTIAEGSLNSASRVVTPLCGEYSVQSLSAVTLTIQGKAASSTVNVGTSQTRSSIEWSLFPIDQSLPAPLIGIPTDWASCTVAFEALGTPSDVEVFCRRVGDSIEVRGSIVIGTPTGSTLTIGLPSYAPAINHDILPGSSRSVVGSAQRGNGSATYPNSDYGPWSLFTDGSANTIFMATSSSAGSLNKTTGWTTSASDIFCFNFSVPILGW